MNYLIRFRDPYDNSIVIEYKPSMRAAVLAAEALERIGIASEVLEQPRR